MTREQKEKLSNLIVYVDENFFQDSKTNHIINLKQKYTYEQQRTIKQIVLQKVLYEDAFWQDVYERIKPTIESPSDESPSDLFCSVSSHLSIFAVVPYACSVLFRGLCNIATGAFDSSDSSDSSELYERYKKPETTDNYEDIKNDVYAEIVARVSEYFKYDLNGLQYMRQFMLHMNREKEADEVESFIKQLIAKNNYISGNYVEKQEINNYGKGK